MGPSVSWEADRRGEEGGRELTLVSIRLNPFINCLKESIGRSDRCS